MFGERKEKGVALGEAGRGEEGGEEGAEDHCDVEGAEALGGDAGLAYVFRSSRHHPSGPPGDTLDSSLVHVAGGGEEARGRFCVCFCVWGGSLGTFIEKGEEAARHPLGEVHPPPKSSDAARCAAALAAAWALAKGELSFCEGLAAAAAGLVSRSNACSARRMGEREST